LAIFSFASGAFGLVGTGAFLAAATGAPVMAIIMLFELTLNYQILMLRMGLDQMAGGNDSSRDLDRKRVFPGRGATHEGSRGFQPTVPRTGGDCVAARRLMGWPRIAVPGFKHRSATQAHFDKPTVG